MGNPDGTATRPRTAFAAARALSTPGFFPSACFAALFASSSAHSTMTAFGYSSRIAFATWIRLPQSNATAHGMAHASCKLAAVAYPSAINSGPLWPLSGEGEPTQCQRPDFRPPGKKRLSVPSGCFAGNIRCTFRTAPVASRIGTSKAPSRSYFKPYAPQPLRARYSLVPVSLASFRAVCAAFAACSCRFSIAAFSAVARCSRSAVRRAMSSGDACGTCTALVSGV